MEKGPKILDINSSFNSHGKIKFVDSLKLLCIIFDINGVAQKKLEN